MDKRIQDSTTEQASPVTETCSDSRRRLIKGVAGATPLLMTVASRPVLGAQCTPSAWVSGNLSDHGHEKMSCGGRSPGYWKTAARRWRRTGYHPGTCTMKHHGICRTYNNDGTPFHSSRRGGVFAGGFYGDRTLMQVLWLDGGADPYQLGAHIVAALLNAASNPGYGMSVADVQDMYRQLEFKGFYQPSSGEPMTTQECVLFIQNTFS